MQSRKPIVAGALVAGSLLLGGGIAAAVVLPDQASEVAEEHTTDVATSQSEAPGADAEEHRQDADHRPDAAEDDEVAEATEVDTEDTEGGERPTDTHGYEVSTFAQETTLTGQEKGAAISELAKTNGGGEDAAAEHQPADAGKPEAAGESGKAPGKP